MSLCIQGGSASRIVTYLSGMESVAALRIVLDICSVTYSGWPVSICSQSDSASICLYKS